MAQREGSAPALPPGRDIGLVIGPGKVLGERLGDVVEVERGVEVVPAEHLEGGEVMASPGRQEVREGDLALIALTVVRDEEKVISGPRLALGSIRGGALVEHHLTQDATQGHHGKALGLELDEEDAPGLVRREWAKALDLLDLGRVLGIDAELFGGVFEGQVLEVLGADGPAHLVPQVGDELVENPDLSQSAAVVGGHKFSLRSVPSSSGAWA
ncbi:MAG: hypothetical protein FJ290_32365 [Planctomycetes bacterium]|nr:hypothetical protein [Planctomycetota bacterium]